MSAQAAERVKQIVDELSAFKIADLARKGDAKAKLNELDSCLSEVRGFAQMVEGLLGHVPGNGNGASAAPRRRAAKAPRAGGVRRKGRRGPGEFPATSFILEQVQKAGKGGVRNTDIVSAIKAARPEGHVRPSALVSTILTRLKAKGQVTRRRGRWYPK